MEETIQKIAEDVAHGDNGMLKTMVAGMLGVAGGITTYAFWRIEKKVSKEVFEEFKKGNDKDHKHTHDSLKHTHESLKRIERKIK